MTAVKRYRFESGYDPMGDCHCSADMVEDQIAGEWVSYSDYMNLLREYSEAFTNDGKKTCANPTCDNRADMYLGNRAYCCNCLQPRMGRNRVQDTANG